MLKKQTVWLLTMLSLMIVLSVYYMLSDSSENIAYVNNGQDGSEEAVPTDSPESDDSAEVNDIENLGGDEMFTEIRMQLENKRSMMKGRLTEVVSSGTASASEKDQALKDIDVLEDVQTKESILEKSIAGDAGFEAVLVRTDGDKVSVHVKTEKLSDTEAVNIMQMVYDEFGRDVKVDVNFQPTAENKK